MPKHPNTANLRDGYLIRDTLPEDCDDCREPALIFWVLACAAGTLLAGLLIAFDPLGLL
ncbi:hypothetical protein [Roseovarius sp.]